ncbi:hypothetical protein SAMN05216330_11387 [Bradyrhizobium sp. Ghvi]|nr:hypothetical protein SAMN05216330_11387 [Bradyrhizobium sp. Ghvi]
MTSEATHRRLRLPFANYTMVFSIPSMIKGWGISDLFLRGTSPRGR